MRSLEGLTIVLMGASGGMGTACALRLAKPGINIAVCSANPARVAELEKKLKPTGAGLYAAAVDVTDEAMHFSLPVSSAAEAPDGAIAVKEINAALAVFPAEYRRPFSMFVAGYKYGEISEILKMPMGTVKSHIFLTRKRLRELLKDYR